MKAILVLEEMPEACGPCRFSERGYQPHCIASGRTHAVDLQRADRPDWCPLKKMPDRKRLPHELDDDDILFGKVCGWNECIEEVEGYDNA